MEEDDRQHLNSSPVEALDSIALDDSVGWADFIPNTVVRCTFVANTLKDVCQFLAAEMKPAPNSVEFKRQQKGGALNSADDDCVVQELLDKLHILRDLAENEQILLSYLAREFAPIFRFFVQILLQMQVSTNSAPESSNDVNQMVFHQFFEHILCLLNAMLANGYFPFPTDNNEQQKQDLLDFIGLCFAAIEQMKPVLMGMAFSSLERILQMETESVSFDEPIAAHFASNQFAELIGFVLTNSLSAELRRKVWRFLWALSNRPNSEILQNAAVNLFSVLSTLATANDEDPLQIFLSNEEELEVQQIQPLMTMAKLMMLTTEQQSKRAAENEENQQRKQQENLAGKLLGKMVKIGELVNVEKEKEDKNNGQWWRLAKDTIDSFRIFCKISEY